MFTKNNASLSTRVVGLPLVLCDWVVQQSNLRTTVSSVVTSRHRDRKVPGSIHAAALTVEVVGE